MDYDRWLQAPYQNDDLLEVEAQKIYVSYDRKALSAEFLEIFGEKVKNDDPICAAIAQRDCEAIGGLLLEAFDRYLAECAEYDARRIQDNW